MKSRGWRSLVAGAIILVALTGPASPAAALEGSSCTRVVAAIQDTTRTAVPDPVRARAAIAAAFAAALRDHPECRNEIGNYGAALRARAGIARHQHGFLGPVGWLWNSIRFRVFHGDGVMMALFGWELFLAPLILVVAARSILSGATGGLRRPAPPPTA